jgi:hypothetical protein
VRVGVRSSVLRPIAFYPQLQKFHRENPADYSFEEENLANFFMNKK